MRAALLVSVGLALALISGVRAARADQMRRAIERDVAGRTRCLGGAGVGDSTCPTVADAEDGRGMDYVYYAATARGQRDRVLGATALGLLALAVGLRRLARRRRRYDRPASALAPFESWGESLIALICLEILALTLDSLAIQLARGLPFTWERLDAAAVGVLVLVSLLTGSPF